MANDAITTDIPCRACRYNLRGNVSGRCPECGLDTAGSVAVFKLDGVSIRWFLALRLGIVLIIFAWCFPVLLRLADAFSTREFHLPYFWWNILYAFVACVTWWGMQLLAEEPHPIAERNSDNKPERRLRLAASVYVAFELLYTFGLPDSVLQYISTPLFPALRWGFLLLRAWFYWEVFNVLGRIVEFIYCPSASRHALFLKRVCAGLYLFDLVCSLIIVACYHIIPEPPLPLSAQMSIFFGPRSFPIEWYINTALQFSFLIAYVWAIVVFVIVYRELGKLRSTASVGGGVFWVPGVVVAGLRWVREMWGLRSYHGEGN